jgi:hypothetical protein
VASPLPLSAAPAAVDEPAEAPAALPVTAPAAEPAKTPADGVDGTAARPMATASGLLP